MINYKKKHNLTGGDNWPSLSTLFFKGIPASKDVSPQNTEEENEKIIQSWGNIAVLRASSEGTTSFNLGFYNKGYLGYLKHDLKTNLEFGVRIGPDDVNIFVFATDMETIVSLELVELTSEDNSKYKDLILL